jgi:hypothetical protein
MPSLLASRPNHQRGNLGLGDIFIGQESSRFDRCQECSKEMVVRPNHGCQGEIGKSFSGDGTGEHPGDHPGDPH